LERKALELSHRFAFVAGGAIERGMCSNQGESVLVVLNRPHRDYPVFHVMTLFAFCTHLPPVDVGMTIRAIFAGVGEDRLDVTLLTRYTLMRAK
jgi:hypothetical protein